jgi:hypothetical protein
MKDNHAPALASINARLQAMNEIGALGYDHQLFHHLCHFISSLSGELIRWLSPNCVEDKFALH